MPQIFSTQFLFFFDPTIIPSWRKVIEVVLEVYIPVHEGYNLVHEGYIKEKN